MAKLPHSAPHSAAKPSPHEERTNHSRNGMVSGGIESGGRYSIYKYRSDEATRGRAAKKDLLLAAGAIRAVEQATLAVGGQLALRTDLAVGHAVAGAANRPIRAGRAVAVRHAEGAALSVGTLTTRSTVSVGLALGNTTFVSAADARDADVALVDRLAVAVLAARRVADAVDASLTGATLSTGDAGLVVDRLGRAVLVQTGATGAAAHVAGASLLAQAVNASPTGAALPVEHAVVRRHWRLLALPVEALAARATVGLDATALRGGGRGLRLAGMTSSVTNEAARAVRLLVAVTSLSALTVGTAVTARRALC